MKIATPVARTPAESSASSGSSTSVTSSTGAAAPTAIATHEEHAGDPLERPKAAADALEARFAGTADLEPGAQPERERHVDAVEAEREPAADPVEVVGIERLGEQDGQAERARDGGDRADGPR